MKTRQRILQLFLALITIGLISCNEEEAQPVKPGPIEPGIISVQFTHNTVTLVENDEPAEIMLAFSQAAEKDGIISLAVTAVDFSGFRTSPELSDGIIELPVIEGQTSASFTFEPIDNASLSDAKTASFTLQSVSDGFSIGTSNAMTISITDDESPAIIGFALQEGTIRENADNGIRVGLAFSHASPGTGVIEIDLASASALYGTHFESEPEAIDGKIVLELSEGTSELFFNLIPKNNTTINGNKVINLSISSASGSVQLNNQINFTLTLEDDELIGKPKGYETLAGSWRNKRMFEYNEAGQIARVLWEQNGTTGINTYHYDGNGILQKISESATIETLYRRDTQGRIILAEKFNAGLLKKYTIYSYDDAGNVGEAAVFDRQPNGEYVMSSLFIYLYYSNTNHLYKRLTYYPIQGTEDFDLVQEETYEYYVQYYATNPFPMVEILPGINVQPFFPSRYTLNRDGQEYSYPLTYVFDEQGMPVRRTTSNGEVTTYQYY
jgi:hypothetical protein